MDILFKWLRRLARIAAVAALIGAAGAWYVADVVLPYSPIKPRRANTENPHFLLPKGLDPRAYDFRADSLVIVTADSLHLRALLLHAQPGPDSAGRGRTTLIMLHGIGGCKEHFFPAAERFTALGLHVVLIDLRAHGQSEGEFCTFGFYEKNDIAALVDTLLRRDSTQRIGILGNSLGGAIALQALGIEPRLQFGIIESTFHDLEAVIAEYGEDKLGFKSPWLADRVIHKSGQIARFNPDLVKPFISCRSITQPVLVVHGEADDKIPPAFGKTNFDNIASSDKQWLPIPGADHYNIQLKGGAAYDSALRLFLRRMMQQPAQMSTIR